MNEMKNLKGASKYSPSAMMRNLLMGTLKSQIKNEYPKYKTSIIHEITFVVDGNKMREKPEPLICGKIGVREDEKSIVWADLTKEQALKIIKISPVKYEYNTKNLILCLNYAEKCIEVQILMQGETEPKYFKI